MKISDLSVGTKITFTGCGDCSGKTPKIKCFFCQPKVKPFGKVVSVYLNFAIPTVEVKVSGSDKLLELSQSDLEDPELVKEIMI